MFITSFNNFSTQLKKAWFTFISAAVLISDTAGQGKEQLVKNNTPQENTSVYQQKDCSHCLQISGKINIARNNNAIAIKVYSSDSLVYIMQSNNTTGRFELYLPFDNTYKIVMAKPGYYDKFMTADTWYPKTRAVTKYEVSFKTDMFKTMEGLDVDVLKQPLVELKYDSSTDVFDFDPEYTQTIIDKIDKLYSDYVQLLSME
jgi:hypothetical protein